MHRRRTLALLSATLTCWVSATVQTALAQTSLATPPASHRWGINDVHQATGLPPIDQQLPEGDLLLRARQAGFGWVRYQVFWHVVNPAPGEYDWLWPDVEIARLRAAGYNILIHVAYPPTWTTGASYPNSQAGAYCIIENTDGTHGVRDDAECLDPEYRPGARAAYRASGYPPGYDRSQDFRTFVRALLDRYGTVAAAWSFGMEVHNKVYWRGSPQQLLDEVLRPGYEEVKQHSPGALVVGPDEDVEDSLDWLLTLEADGIAAGKSPVFDVVAFHAFAHSGWARPEQLEEDWRRGRCTFEGTESQQDCHLKRIMEVHGRGRPLWLTEVGYRTADPREPSQAQAASTWLSAWIRGIKARPWIDKTFIFTLRRDFDSVAGDCALFLNDEGNTEVPALAAVRAELAAQPLPQFSYLAEGATNGFFDLDVLVANPAAAPAPVKLTFLSEDGSVTTLADTLPATSRRTYGVGRTHAPALATAPGISTVVESTQGAPLVVERSMFWNRSQYYGGHGGTAVPQPESQWYFGEGAQGFFDTYVLLANSGGSDARVRVTFLLDEAGADPVVVERTVKANKRDTVWAGDPQYPRLAGKSFSIAVEADQPIIAERAMYFGASPFWAGGHESAGVPSLSPTWLLAEGATGPFFDNYVLVGNPGELDAEVRFTFLLPGGRVVVGTPRRAAGATGLGVIAARSRFTLDVENAGLALDILEGDAAWLADTAVSTKVEASVPIVVERAMYWPGDFTSWTEAHNSFGVTETGTAWGLAEGRNGGPRDFETYILVANPSGENATIAVTFLLPDGTTTRIERTVEANSRFNVWPWEMPAGEFGAVVESTNGVPIVVERAMYWTPSGGPAWGGGTNATAVRLR